MGLNGGYGYNRVIWRMEMGLFSSLMFNNS